MDHIFLCGEGNLKEKKNASHLPFKMKLSASLTLFLYPTKIHHYHLNSFPLLHLCENSSLPAQTSADFQHPWVDLSQVIRDSNLGKHS